MMLYHVMCDVMLYDIILSSIVSLSPSSYLSVAPSSHLSVSPSSHLYQGELLVILLGTAEEGDQ